jgi:hypothetical protein
VGERKESTESSLEKAKLKCENNPNVKKEYWKIRVLFMWKGILITA